MISIVIPTLDEQRLLPRCLEALAAQAGDAPVETLVVDGGSRDATRSVAREAGVRLIRSPAGRGRQMNRGAAEASGSLVVFLPADSVLEPGALRALRTAQRTGHPLAGGLRQRFDRRSALLSVVSCLHNMRAACTGVMYGDQVLFLPRRLFLELGGFREDVDMEDVELGERLRRRTRPRLLRAHATTSARRFERAGALRATGEAVWILGCRTFLRRVPRSRTFFTPVR